MYLLCTVYWFWLDTRLTEKHRFVASRVWPSAKKHGVRPIIQKACKFGRIHFHASMQVACINLGLECKNICFWLIGPSCVQWSFCNGKGGTRERVRKKILYLNRCTRTNQPKTNISQCKPRLIHTVCMHENACLHIWKREFGRTHCFLADWPNSLFPNSRCSHAYQLNIDIDYTLDLYTM